MTRNRKKEKTPPNYKKLDNALRSIGYSFEAAVADLIDNSIDAKATKILVRFVLQKDKPLDLIIWDDGTGMDGRKLREAMRFGADIDNDIERLGKFGLGLKLASLSQAKELEVITRKSGKDYGRAWEVDGISNGFETSILNNSECKRTITDFAQGQSWKNSGTLVRWVNLYRVGNNFSDPEEHAQKLLERLRKYLSLAFHRFLGGKARRINIEIDIFDGDSSLEGLPLLLKAIDPFGYHKTGHKDYPEKFSLPGEFSNKLSMTGHIWPPNSKAPEYQLPGGANSRQGFYFYRNNRLIQGGGWNGMMEPEPHRSLARLEIDMHPDFDVELNLDVKKMEIQLHPPLVKAIQKAQTKAGVDFKKYLSIADKTYRTKPLTAKELPLIPFNGLPTELKKFLISQLKIKGSKKYRKLDFKWADMEKEKVFLMDPESDILHLNKFYRKQLTKSSKGSSADAPIVKCLLFLTLKDVLNVERQSAKTREYIDLVNCILVRAIKCETSGK